MNKLKVIAVHDAAGRIDGFVTSHVDAPSGAPVTDPGLTMTEIDLPEAMVESDEADAIERLSGVLQRYQADYLVMRETEASVVRKAANGDPETGPRSPDRNAEDS